MSAGAVEQNLYLCNIIFGLLGQGLVPISITNVRVLNFVAYRLGGESGGRVYYVAVRRVL